ncbi:hypothetical protein LCGC14_2882320, partial [marine sediment metagenome]
MLTDEQLAQLAGELESHNVERTTSTTDTEKFCIAICAFANDFPDHRKPGYLLIGVDESGRSAGIEVTERLLERVGGLRSDGNILPLPAMTVERRSLHGADIVLIEVLPSDLPPVRYRGRVWIRVGPRRAVATEQEERILSERRARSIRSFDARACEGCGLAEL